MDIYMPELTIAGILGFLAPLLVAVVNQPKFSPLLRRVIAIVVSVLLALVALLISGTFMIPTDPRGVGISILAVVGIAQMAYALVWKPAGLTDQLEAATSSTIQKKDSDLDGEIVVEVTEEYELHQETTTDPLDQPGPDHRKE